MIRFVLLVWVGPEFEEEFGHFCEVSPDSSFEGRVHDVRVFLVVDIGAGVQFLARPGQVVALDRLVQG